MSSPLSFNLSDTNFNNIIDMIRDEYSKNTLSFALQKQFVILMLENR